MLPVPATFTIELGQQLGEKNVSGVQIRLYSDYPFRERKDGGVRIAYRGRVVTTLAGRVAARFIARAEGADAEAQQQLMARATGNFKRGNERPTR